LFWCRRKQELSELFLQKPRDRGSVAIRWLVVRAKEQCRVVPGAEHYHNTELQKMPCSGLTGDLLNQAGSLSLAW